MLVLVLLGLNVAQSAAVLGKAPNTVKKQRKTILMKRRPPDDRHPWIDILHQVLRGEFE